MISLRNRRYIGNKTKLLKQIYNSIDSKFLFNNSNMVFADLFAGTGVVSEYFGENGFDIIINDILYSNYVAYQAYFSKDTYSSKKIEEYLNNYNSIKYENIEENYFSKIYSGKYFSVNDAKKIGYIREDLENNKKKLSKREFYILLTSLIYITDKIANTVGHFEHYLKAKPVDSNFMMSNLDLKGNYNAFIFNEDANELAKKIKADIVYIDPPYNARQYVNFYHVLENLARWEKPNEFEGISMKFKRNHLKSGYSRTIAKSLMEDLITSLEAKYIIVSYNNTYNAKSGASNNKISENEMIQILEKKGTVKIFDIPHKYFNSGKTDFQNHLEKIFVCKVGE